MRIKRLGSTCDSRVSARWRASLSSASIAAISPPPPKPPPTTSSGSFWGSDLRCGVVGADLPSLSPPGLLTLAVEYDSLSARRPPAVIGRGVRLMVAALGGRSRTWDMCLLPDRPVDGVSSRAKSGRPFEAGQLEAPVPEMARPGRGMVAQSAVHSVLAAAARAMTSEIAARSQVSLALATQSRSAGGKERCASMARSKCNCNRQQLFHARVSRVFSCAETPD